MGTCPTRSLIACFIWSIAAASGQSAAETGSAQDRARANENFIPAISLIEERLAAQPANDAMRFELASLLGWAGRYHEALDQYNALIDAHPNNVDYALGRAQALAWQGSDAKALEELERATFLAPDYEAVWQLRIRLLRRQQPAADSADLQALRAEAQIRFPQSQWWQTPPPERDIRWQLTLGAAYEYLSNDLPDWNNQFLTVDWLRDENSRYFVRTARDTRFENSDRQFAIGAAWRFRTNWSAGIELNTSPGADFQPKSGFSLHTGRLLGHGWGADIRLRQRHFATATVITYTGTVERYFGNYRTAYGLNTSHLHGSDNSLAHTLTMDWYVTPGHSLRLDLGAGEEAEVVGTGRVLESAVSSVTLSGRHLLNPRLMLSWWAGTHRQGDFYRRRYAGLAVTVGI